MEVGARDEGVVGVAGAQVTVNRNEEQVARVRLQQELERLRQKAEQEMQQQLRAKQHEAQQRQQQQQEAQRQQQGGAAAEGAAPLDEEAQRQLRCSLKVTWDAATRCGQLLISPSRPGWSEHGCRAGTVPACSPWTLILPPHSP